jgi:methylenetetrahydrofolate reductase (NADPH)
MALLRLQRSLREGRFANEAGEELKGTAPHLHIGATANPFAPDADVEIQKIKAKMEAGADFFQTQITYMPDALDRFLERLRASDLPSWPRLIIGVGPFKHLKMAIHMRDKVWGVEVPDTLIQRMEQASDEGEEGKKICVEVIERLRETDGVAGCHVMAVVWEESVPEILERAGLA